MKINHLNLTVANVQAVRRYLEKYFGLRSMDGTSDDASFIGMLDEEGFVLTLMQPKGNASVEYPPTFHLGFLNQGEQRVQEIYQQLIEDGFEVKPPGFYHEDDLCVNTPFGFTIQVS